VLSNVSPSSSATSTLRSIKATPLKPKILLHKKVSKSAAKKQRDLLKECIEEVENQGVQGVHGKNNAISFRLMILFFISN